MIDVLEHIPEPVTVLATVRRLVQPGGYVAIKVPCGRSQWHKERVLAAIDRSHRVSLAENLVHVNHFSPKSLTLALQRAGFERVELSTAPPELLPLERSLVRRALSNAIRLGVYAMSRVPGAIRTPLALNLQAIAHVPA
jgi:hypothetical protein